jgi:hypothetical protein
MDEQFALDVLVDYATEPDDPDRLVVNPAWRTFYRDTLPVLGRGPTGAGKI